MLLTLNPLVAAAVVSALCYSCRQATSQCVECAVVVLVDPDTDLPLDLVRLNGRLVTRPVDQAMRDRGAQRLLCDECVITARTRKPGHIGDTATERHARGLCVNAFAGN